MPYKPKNSKLFGDAIKHLLNQKGLSQRKFAETAKLTTDYVSKLVNGKVAEPRQEQRRKIAKGLGVTEQELQNLVAQYIENYEKTDDSVSTRGSEKITPSLPSIDNPSATSATASTANIRKIYQNLPAPTYTEFIGRNAEMSRLLELLSPDHSAHIITVDGIGGVGKTALVIEAAYKCLKASRENLPDAPIFDAIIFTSAKQQYLTPSGILLKQQAERNLRDIFREIANTLNEPVITRSASEDQRDRVRQSLAKQRTLLIVDNMETIQDTENVLSFLYDLPSNVKVVITTRQQVVFIPIRLPNLSQDEGLQLIKQQAEEKGIILSDEESRKLYDRTGGVPIAIIYAIGQLCYGYPLESVLEQLTSNTGDVAKFCFKESVEKIKDRPPHKLLMSLAIFPEPAVRAAVAEVAGLTADPAAVNDGLAKLQRLSLVSLNQKTERFSMLSLTREYALAELAAYRDFDTEARERWVKWYLNFVQENGGEDWAEWHNKFDRLENEWANLLAVLYWCKEQRIYENVRDLWQSLNDFMRLYGYWEDRIDWLEWLIAASQESRQLATTVDVMACKGWTLTQMGGQENLETAEKLFEEAWNLREEADIETQADLAYCRADFYRCQKKYEEAEEWLNIQEKLVNEGKANWERKKYIRLLLHGIYNRARIKYSKGEYEEAKKLFEQDLNYAQEIGWQRAEIDDLNYLADIAIQEGDLEKAEELLNKGSPMAKRNKYKRRIACYQASFARLEKARGNSNEAREWANKALDGFKRLAMTKDAQEMPNLLAELERGNQASREKLL